MLTGVMISYFSFFIKLGKATALQVVGIILEINGYNAELADAAGEREKRGGEHVFHYSRNSDAVCVRLWSICTRSQESGSGLCRKQRNCGTPGRNILQKHSKKSYNSYLLCKRPDSPDISGLLHFHGKGV